MRNSMKRRLAFALSMALITSSLASAAGLMRNYGVGPEFCALWLHTFSVTFPTVVFSPSLSLHHACNA